MDYLVKIDDKKVATITLNRPDIHNAFNDQLITDLINCFIRLEDNSEVKVVVLTGAGKSFCAGADLNWMKRMKDYSFEENLADSKKLCELFTTINNFKKPVIGKINGSALGGGAGLLAVCDYVLAVDSASFGFTEVRLGLLPAVISPFVIAKIGESYARAYFLTGQKFNAQKAQTMGLIHQVTSFDKIEEDLELLINEYLLAAPLATYNAKKLISNVVNSLNFETLCEYTCETISKARKSAEGQEGMSSLLEKRKPNWLK
jgi:methylglutaconyl-CoA hydratase